MIKSPWHAAKTEECDASKPWGVIVDDTGEVVGCHETEESANRQIAALNAQGASDEPEAKAEAEKIEAADGPTRIKSFDVEAKADGERGEFTALASVFGNVDLVGDRMMPGAFAKTLEKRRDAGRPWPVIWSHDWDDPFSMIGGADPDDVKETDRGLEFKGKLDLANPKATQVYNLLKQGLVTAMSFGFSVVSEKMVKGVNESAEVELVEMGPTLKGANPEAQLQAVKAIAASDVPVDGGVTAKGPERVEAQGHDPLYQSSMRAVLDVKSDGIVPIAAEFQPDPVPPPSARELRQKQREIMLDLLVG